MDRKSSFQPPRAPSYNAFACLAPLAVSGFLGYPCILWQNWDILSGTKPEPLQRVTYLRKILVGHLTCLPTLFRRNQCRRKQCRCA